MMGKVRTKTRLHSRGQFADLYWKDALRVRGAGCADMLTGRWIRVGDEVKGSRSTHIDCRDYAQVDRPTPWIQCSISRQIQPGLVGVGLSTIESGRNSINNWYNSHVLRLSSASSWPAASSVALISEIPESTKPERYRITYSCIRSSVSATRRRGTLCYFMTG